MEDKNTYRVLGMMSGTSLDGLDMALCHFHRREDAWSYDLVRSGFTEYTPEMKAELEGAIALDAPRLLELDARYGAWLGKEAARFMGTGTADAVASHGHTVHHRPELGFTYQLGAPQYVATASGMPAIGDFRSADIALGGQGAPLVPIGDRLLFGQYPFCLNLGGIANISFEQDGQRRAYDIGVANMLLNHLVRPMQLAYDRDGQLARAGTPNTSLLRALDALPYYEKPYPKSTGYEWFREVVLPLTEKFPDKPENQLRTGVQHIANQIAVQLHKISGGKGGDILVTGGGAHNAFLIERLQEQLGPGLRIALPDRELINFKEAVVFGFLGALRMAGCPNVLASVTGASRDSCSGVLCLP
jgi:anhydro-N-acetylmuramic acid kinase